ncbi:hypothetical protein [Hyphomicrobium sp. D-2]|uniref:hypothetical protein n=1 Tax=Hyphomicrobium sp. D-2 TaxID=3041621 RepID=UPI0024554601|nr:hypothetical protein [Hyphomicrobium sp. D-2]MDH4983155.1 hypothetical protein [Hyphomicrobium sp. D-2]
MRVATLPYGRLLAFLPLAVLSVPADAQTRNFLQRPTTITVQYVLRLPLKSDGLAEQQTAMEEGRKALYAMSARECTALMATLASSCRLASLNIQTNVGRPRPDDHTITLSANAQYQIELKAQDGERSKDEL